MGKKVDWYNIKPMPDMTPAEALAIAIRYITASNHSAEEIEEKGVSEFPIICQEAIETLPGEFQRHFEYAGKADPDDPDDWE